MKMPELSLLWNQEFDSPSGSGLDPAFWVHDLGDGSSHGIPGWGNNELEYYTDSAATTDGSSCLVIEARRNTAAKPLPVYYGETAEWTSARLTTAGKVAFLYGRVEARLKFPAGEGTWPAFWMLGENIAQVGWPSCGEIDIAEGRGDQPSALYTTLHGPGYSGDKGKGLVKDLGYRISDDFHTFAIDWLPNSITWLVDGVAVQHFTPADVPGDWVYNAPHYVLMNLAMGGNFTGPVDPQLNAADYKIDYVRHYQLDGVGEVFLR
mgnify:CR=1 FL=1|jgi:beta-glucanase (GH16 family)